MGKQFVIVSGFEASGSSAVVDLLKKFRFIRKSVGQEVNREIITERYK